MGQAQGVFQTTLPIAPISEAVTPITPGIPNGDGSTVTVTTLGVTDNTTSPVATASNPLPLASASLMSASSGVGTSSSSFRVVAGADLNSANPLGLQAAAMFDTAAGGGNVTLDGHFAFVDSNGLALLAPTMIRTGTGSINIAAASNVALMDSLAPGVIYTAGTQTQAAGAPAEGTSASIINGGTVFANPDIFVSPTVNPEGAGDISIHAQNDITASRMWSTRAAPFPAALKQISASSGGSGWR
ncbi:MAG: hypothetical protein WDN30_16015 [Pararobbsia sp.]